MTLGQQLSQFRKRSFMTQQELGERLNISAQAISKWENDLSEPDLATLKKLAELYGVSISTLLDFEEKDEVAEATYEAYETYEPVQPAVTDEDVSKISDIVTEAVSEQVSRVVYEEIHSGPRTIGFCIECGITVTEDNLGEESPRVLCRSCVEAREQARIGAERQAAIDAENAERAYQATMESNRHTMRFKRNLSAIVGGIIATVFLAILLVAVIQSPVNYFGSLAADIAVSCVITYAVFAFVASLFYEGPVRDFVLYMITKTVSFPGLIFTWDLDGFIWLIGMKILFAILGFLAGVLFAIVGIVGGIIIAPFVYPFRLAKINRLIKEGDIEEYNADF
ncbi:MAG: helix-turn-helix domain-containing protein [Clostridia bacterium]|nr:helix-turn-helix domain-containing protein [Clostridia bacterium]